MTEHVYQGACPDFVDSVIRDPECPACVEMVDAYHARACDARHIARLERLVRAQCEALDDAEGHVALHRMQALDLQRRLAKHEEARQAEAAERSWL